MSRTFVVQRLLPSILIFLAVPAVAIGVDVILHAADVAWVGRTLGPVGTGFVVASFLYSLRKRGWMKSGAPRKLLALHEVFAWIGAVLLLVHAGIHFNAWIPWLATFALLVVTATGLTGKYLLADARRALDVRKSELREGGATPDEIEQRLAAMALLTSTMQKWRSVHMPLTTIFAALVVVHVAATVLLW
ncbi:MAG: hypothetical protein K8T90_18745 [Planctomycetes bacterium]|nr:hypothetical protein [Planctomycetota bacterium]